MLYDRDCLIKLDSFKDKALQGGFAVKNKARKYTKDIVKIQL